ncbi:MAG: isoleucine--tRNA ligase [Thermodesulfobacteriota bacterium]
MDYRDTLNLPQTSFPMKASLAANEPRQLARWQEEGLYARIQEATANRPLYVLHDGPPYANGHIHMGTAFNKVLKDIILKSRRMAGFHCPYVPGWDCHGLPIEHQVDKELGAKKKELDKLAVRQHCRRFAEKWIDTQREEFRRLGVLGDWDEPYLTMTFGYEAAIAREFNRFLLSGAVVRSKKPVYWCSSCTTALAEAEVEYADHASPSIYVKFPLIGDPAELAPALAGRQVSLVIWTTTPWTLPGNLAVALHPDFPYVALAVGDEVWIVAEGLAFAALAACGREPAPVLARLAASDLAGRRCRHPFLDRDSRIILADYVTQDTGTGCVHTAPGHGREDYLSGLKYDLPILSPVDDRGRFTAEAGPYQGQLIWEANPVITRDLAAAGALAAEATISHSYPHCWRCKRPVFFRATAQWFLSMEHDQLRDRALAAIKTVTWTPKWGMERISGMIEARPDWCLSRQRAWGVPITVFACADCGTPVRDQGVAERIVALFAEHGADIWFTLTPAAILGEDARCSSCGSASFRREDDILDVWFDSGVSFAAVLEERPGLRSPADLYLEGSDQHRGWFHSSLLAAIGTRGVPPYRGVLTHGFVVDGQGKKMSKSLGNVIAPAEIIRKYGAEILRLWVSAEDYRDDIKISDEILSRLSDAYRKIRNTIRFLLGNLYDFEPARDRVAYQELSALDRWALHHLETVKRRVLVAYQAFDFHIVYQALHQFCAVTMSALYLDILKDRLYTSPAASPGRRGAQTVLHEILDSLVRLMAPVLSFTAAEVWDQLPADPAREANPFVALFPAERPEHLDEALAADWERLLAVRSEITRALELARAAKTIGHSLEAEVLVEAEPELAAFLDRHWPDLAAASIVSTLTPARLGEGEAAFASETIPGLRVAVRPAAGAKCERCWTRAESVGTLAQHPALCQRCAAVVTGSWAGAAAVR